MDGHVKVKKQGRDERKHKKATLLRNDSGKEGQEDYTLRLLHIQQI